jgi:hypothetical protein
MANPTTAAEWQESKNALVTQRADLVTQQGSLLSQNRSLEFRAALTAEQLRKATDPVQRAELRSQYESITIQLQQTNNQINQNQADQATLSFQIERANEKILLAGTGAPNTNTATEPANNDPGSNTQAQPIAPLVTPSEKISVPSQLYTEVSPTGTGQVSYDVVDTDQGEIVTSFSTQAEANEYMVSQAYAPGSVGPAPSEPPITQEVIDPNNDPTVGQTEIIETQLVITVEDLIDPGEEFIVDPPSTEIVQTDEEFIFEPLQEPPPTEVDEFTGIDEQVERQRQLEDGSLEFAGIDDQIAANENTLQEPPELSDDEVDSYIRQAGQQDETITSPNSITESVFDPTGNNGASIEESVFDPTGNQGAPRGLSISLNDTRSKATQQDVSNFQAKPDWRVRLSLAPGATYLYKAEPLGATGILAPLAATDGVIFPYTPAISVQYAASYDATELTHSNYKFFTYKGSAVDSISITCDFTAQDTFEANYLLAVIHFFRSVTKMFYGQDQNPKIGTPPPLCYLSGLGAFQFDAHPLAITSFNYTLPTDVDYIRAGATPTPAGVSRAPSNIPINSSSVSGNRAIVAGLITGALNAPPKFNAPAGSRDVTYVPTKMQISIQAVPIVTRNDISNKFSLTEYATGKLLRGTQRQGGGIW